MRPCDFPINKYVPLDAPDDPLGAKVCRWPDYEYLPDACGKIVRRGGPPASPDHVFKVEFLGGRKGLVLPGDVDAPEGDDGFRPFAGTAGPPTDRFALYSARFGPNATDPPAPTLFRLYAGGGCIVTKVFEGIFAPPSLDAACDLVVQVTGPLATHWQLWTMVDKDVQATPYAWEVLALLDRSRRCRDVCGPELGPYTTQVFPTPPVA